MAVGTGQLTLTVTTGVVLFVVAWTRTNIENWRSYTPSGGVGTGEDVDHREKPGGVVRWLTTVDHRDVGVLYGAFVAFVWNVVVSWREGKRVESDDPWNLAAHGHRTREWAWFADNRRPAVADGGDDPEPGD
jgi:cytochrome c oxidase subunit 1